MVEAVLSRRRPLNVLVAVLLLLLVLMSYQIKDEATGRTLLTSLFFRLISPLQMAVSWTFRTTADAVDDYLTLAGAEQENEKLHREVTELRIQLQTKAIESEENERLRQVLDLRRKLSYQMTFGEVIAGDARASLSRTLTLNRGALDGVRKEMPVITPTGIVGMTILVTPRTSRVQVITDTASSVGAMLQRSGISGLLVGTGKDVCVLRFLPLTTDIKKDDLVITSGLDGVFPEGLPIGKVTEVLNESEYYLSARVVPFQNSNSVREAVFLTHSSYSPSRVQ